MGWGNWKLTRGFTKIFDRRRGGLLFFFLHLLKKESFFCVFFFMKEDHPNYSMLEESLLAYLLYKYTLYRTFIINVKVTVFLLKSLFLLSEQQLRGV